jgi:hypothetical protein
MGWKARVFCHVFFIYFFSKAYICKTLNSLTLVWWFSTARSVYSRSSVLLYARLEHV